MCFWVCSLLWACTTAVSTHVRTHVRTHAEITRTPLSCSGDECDADSLSLLRQSYIQTCILVCKCLCVCIFVVCLLSWVYKIAVCLTLSFSSIQVTLFGQQSVVGPARHFYRAFIASVSVRVSRGCLQSTLLYKPRLTIKLFWGFWLIWLLSFWAWWSSP